MKEDIANCCAMCLLEKGKDFIDLFRDTQKGKMLNKYGKMYEDLLNIKIEDERNFPNYICSSCSLQLQLSINLKQKALDSFHKIISLNDEIFVAIKKEKDLEEYDINFNEDNDSVILTENSELSNDNGMIEMDFTETINRDDDSNQTYFSNSNKNSYIDDDCTEFLDVQFLKEEYDEEIDNKKVEFETLSNSKDNESENEEKLSLKIDQNDFKSLNAINIHKIERNSETKTNERGCSTPKIKSNNTKKVKNTKKRTKYLCDLCSRISYSQEALEVHKKVHAGLPAFICEVCEKNFKQKVHYRIHMMNHTNERNYECEECGKKFRTKSDLRIHFEIHTGERRYACDICNKAYRAHSHMKNHRYTHFEKQLECPFCKQKYISPATLKTHIKTIHEMTTPQHECMQCHKKFKRKHHLQVHLKTHNKDKQIENVNGSTLQVIQMTDYIRME